MIIKVENGKSLIQLKMNELGSYLKFIKPLAINWSDCQGSIAQFYAIFSYTKEHKEKIDVDLKEKLNSGEFKLKNNINHLNKLLSLFENATYELSFEPEYVISDFWDIAKNHHLYTSNQIMREKGKIEFCEDKEHLDFISESYYDGFSEYFIYTQPTESLNQERIKHYEELLNTGIRPTAIIYSGQAKSKGNYKDGTSWQSNYNSGNFILDGHHKLAAYKNLNLPPSLLRITKMYSSTNKLNFNLKDFKTDIEYRLQKSQAAHYLENIS